MLKYKPEQRHVCQLHPSQAEDYYIALEKLNNLNSKM